MRTATSAAAVLAPAVHATGTPNASQQVRLGLIGCGGRGRQLLEVMREFPDVEFVRPCNLCPHMKKITLDGIRNALETMQHEVHVEPAIAARARMSVERMLEVGRSAAAAPPSRQSTPAAAVLTVRAGRLATDRKLITRTQARWRTT